MYLKSIDLQNFRSYKKADFTFSSNTTLIVGPNTAGKTNLMEAIFLLSKGASFRADRDEQLIKFDQDIARIKGKVGVQELEVVIAGSGVGGHIRPFKKYLVNGVNRRKVDFVGNFLTVLFAPGDLDIVIGAPSKRRDFIDNILTQVDRDYRIALTFYEKGLRIRNALLHKAKETGARNEKEFVYWNNLLIGQGQKITKKREDFLKYIMDAKKDILDFEIFYDKSTISKERLLQYKDAEVGAGVTLVGPHRDDFSIRINSDKEIKFFGSRGQQRLAVLQLKLLELIFIEKTTGEKPILLLDDIFSELDSDHIKLVLDIINKQQTIITTTHKEFIPKKILEKLEIINLVK